MLSSDVHTLCHEQNSAVWPALLHAVAVGYSLKPMSLHLQSDTTMPCGCQLEIFMDDSVQ